MVETLLHHHQFQFNIEEAEIIIKATSKINILFCSDSIVDEPVVFVWLF